MILILSKCFTTLVILLQSYFLVLEMFLWQTPKGRKIFGSTPEFARDTSNLAKNMGLYNGFLAAGLLWGVTYPEPKMNFQIQGFFLICVAIAGIYGAATANRRILYVQALPAIIALTVLALAQ